MQISRYRGLILSMQKHFLAFDDDIVHLPVPLNFPSPIFVIGVPRSGTTLFSQFMLSYCDFSYITNLCALFPSKLKKTIKLHKLLHKTRWDKITESQFGYIPGLFAPNEAGKVFEFWLGEVEEESHRQKVFKTLHYFQNEMQGQLFIKNLSNSLRIRQIRSVFPMCRFIWIKRDPVFTFQSILTAKELLYGKQAAWFGVAPDGYEQFLSRPPEEQIAWQIATIEKAIISVKADFPDALLEIDYAEFCHDPLYFAGKISEMFGVRLRRFEKINFKTSEKLKLSAALVNKFTHIYNKYLHE